MFCFFSFELYSSNKRFKSYSMKRVTEAGCFRNVKGEFRSNAYKDM